MSVLQRYNSANINQLMERLQKNTIGMDDYFDRVFGVEAQSYPPYNLIQVSEDESHLEMALAGFSKEDIEVEIADGTLSVRSDKKDDASDKIYRGISFRKFNRKFTLSDDIVVNDASLNNGMLSINLERIIPEEKKPRLIPVK